MAIQDYLGHKSITNTVRYSSLHFVVGIYSKNAHGRIRLVPARTALHARTGAQVAREARSPLNESAESIYFT